MDSMRAGMACSTTGRSADGSGPSSTDPKAMMAASRRRQSVWRMLSLTKGSTCGTTSSSQQVASSMRQTPAALHGFQSSSSSLSSCLVSVSSRMGTMYCRAPLA